MRLPGLRQRIAGADAHVELAQLDEREDAGGVLAEKVGRARVGLYGRPLYVQRTVPREECDWERVGLTACGAVQDHLAEGPDRLETLVKRCLAYAVVDSGHTLP